MILSPDIRKNLSVYVDKTTNNKVRFSGSKNSTEYGKYANADCNTGKNCVMNRRSDDNNNLSASSSGSDDGSGSNSNNRTKTKSTAAATITMMMDDDDDNDNKNKIKISLRERLILNS